MQKNILVISSSPRIGGNSDTLCAEFARGAKESGHTVQTLHLQKMNIRPCIGCEACHQNGGTCVQKDDMEQLFEAMSVSDVLVLATPVYFYDVSAQLKTMIDRTYSKFYTQPEVFHFREAVFISTCEAGANLFEIPKMLYQNLIRSFDHPIKDRGMILESGAGAAGTVSTKGKQAAYQLGLSL